MTFVTQIEISLSYYFYNMKLRIRGNSIRLRLTRSELDLFRSSGIVEQVVEFEKPSRSLSYRLRISPTSAVIAAEFDGRSIDISIPETQAQDWASSDLVGIECMQPIGGGRSLRILVEKDFACLTPRKHEDEKEAFPNPSVTGKC